MSTELMGAVAFMLTFAAAVGGLYKYINAQVSAPTKIANETQRELAAYQRHVAETYATKAGMTEQMNALGEAVRSVGDRVEKRLDGMNERLDRVIETNHKPVPRRSAS
jgi:hypothetical protein